MTFWHWRLIGWGLLAALVAFAGWRVSAWHAAYEALPAAQEALEAEQLCQMGSKCFERQLELQEELDRASQQTIDSLASELEAVRSRRPGVRAVRVCAGSGNLQGAAAARAVDGAGAAAGQLSGSPGRDLAPELYELAKDADEVAARLRALQGWNQALAGEK